MYNKQWSQSTFSAEHTRCSNPSWIWYYILILLILKTLFQYYLQGIFYTIKYKDIRVTIKSKRHCVRRYMFRYVTGSTYNATDQNTEHVQCYTGFEISQSIRNSVKFWDNIQVGPKGIYSLYFVPILLIIGWDFNDYSEFFCI